MQKGNGIKIDRLFSKQQRHQKKIQKHQHRVDKYDRAICRLRAEDAMMAQFEPEHKSTQPEKKKQGKEVRWATGEEPLMRHKKHVPPPSENRAAPNLAKKHGLVEKVASTASFTAPYNAMWVYHLAKKMGHDRFKNRFLQQPYFKERGIVDYNAYQAYVVKHYVQEQRAGSGHKDPTVTTLNQWKRMGRTYAKATFAILAMADTDGKWPVGDVMKCFEFFQNQQFGDWHYWIAVKLPTAQADRHATGMKKLIAWFHSPAPEVNVEAVSDCFDNPELTAQRLRLPTKIMTASGSTKATDNYITKSTPDHYL